MVPGNKRQRCAVSPRRLSKRFKSSPKYVDNVLEKNLPEISDTIKVKWRIKNSVVWWPAKVLNIDHSSSLDCIATGSILYSKYEAGNVQYDSEEANVEFIVSSTLGNVLRTKGSSDKNLCTWIRCTGSDSGDSSSNADNPIPKQIGETSAGDESSKLNTTNLSDIPNEESVDLEFRNQNKRLADLEDMVQDLQSNMFDLKNVTNGPPEDDHTSDAIMNILKWNLLKKLQNNHKPSSKLMSGPEGHYSNFVSVSTPCTLQQFRQVALSINKKTSDFGHRRGSQITFLPSLKSIQKVSKAVTKYRIVVSDLPTLCEILCLNDELDYENILSREHKDKCGRFIRIVGTSMDTGFNDSSKRMKKEENVEHSEQIVDIPSLSNRIENPDSDVNITAAVTDTVVGHDVDSVRDFPPLTIDSKGTSNKQGGDNKLLNLTNTKEEVEIVKFIPASAEKTSNIYEVKRETLLNNDVNEVNKVAPFKEIPKNNLTGGKNKLSSTRLLIGLSLLHERRVNDTDLDTSGPSSLVFEQLHKLFDETDGTYRTRWRSRRIYFDMKSFSKVLIEEEEFSSKFISFTWTKETPPSKTKWTVDAYSSDNCTLGQLRIDLPVVVVHGPRTTADISRLLDKHIERLMPEKLLLLPN